METIRKFPKIELHCHLDGSIPPATIRELLNRREVDEELTVSEDCQSLREYLEKFELPLTCMQTKEGLRRVAEDFMLSLKEDGVRYVEVRFAPMLSTQEGLSLREVLEAVLLGLEKGRERSGIQYNVIACAMRHHTPESNFQVLRASMEFLGAGVTALDLAGDENAFPNKNFAEFFRKAKSYGIPFTIHSGECQSLANVKAACEFGASRVGHGIALKKDRDLMRLFAKKGIGVELCPTSNLQTKAVQSWEDYPLETFCRSGIFVSINTDNRTVSKTDLTREISIALDLLEEEGGCRKERLDVLKKLQKNAIDTAFASDAVKQELWREVESF